MSALEAVRFHDGDRYCAALVAIGRTRLRAVVIDDAGVRVIVEPKEAQRYCSPLTLRGQPYPIARLVKHMRRIGRERGITEAAKHLLQEAMS